MQGAVPWGIQHSSIFSKYNVFRKNDAVFRLIWTISRQSAEFRDQLLFLLASEPLNGGL